MLLLLHDQMLCKESHNSSQVLSASVIIRTYHIANGKFRLTKNEANVLAQIHTNGSTLDGEIVDIMYLLRRNNQTLLKQRNVMHVKIT